MLRARRSCYSAVVADAELDLPALAGTDGRRAEQVMEAVRSALDAGVMRAGVKYSVYQLSASLGVSRTPVRDALLRLEEVGLIRFEARQGFRILLPDPRAIADIFAIRLALELPAVGRAAVLCDAALTTRLHDRMALLRAAADDGDDRTYAAHDQLLHDHLLEAAGNSRVRDIVRSQRESIRLLGASTTDRLRSLDDIDAQHRPIIAAVTRNQPTEAVAAMRAHLTSTGRMLVAQAIRDQDSPLDGATVWADAVGPHDD